MSLDLFVILAPDCAPNSEQWQRAMTARGVPLQFSCDFDVATHSGFVRTTVDEHASGFYYFVNKTKDLELGSLTPAGVDVSKLSIAYTLNYGGNLYEAASVFHAATVLVSDFGGRAFNPQGGRWMEIDELKEAAATCIRLAKRGI